MTSYDAWKTNAPSGEWPPCARRGCGHDWEDHGWVSEAQGEQEIDPPCRVDGCACDYYMEEPDPEEEADERARMRGSRYV